MSNRGGIRYVFTSIYTGQGFATFIPDLLEGLRKVFILKGAPGSGKSTLIRMLGQMLYEKGYDVEFWVSSLNPITPDGVYVAQLDMAVVNGSLPQAIDPRYPGRDEMIDLGGFWDKDLIETRTQEIVERIDETFAIRKRVYHLLDEANQIRRENRNLLKDKLNAERTNLLIKQLCQEMLSCPAGEKHYFASALTAEGRVSYINELSESCRKRYILQGPPGSGKSRVIKEIAEEAKKKGYFLEYYHCGLEPALVDMLIIKNLQIALIAGEIEVATRHWDVLIDMSECLDPYDADQWMLQTSEGMRRMEGVLDKAQLELETLSNQHRQLKKIFSAAMDFDRLDQKMHEIFKTFDRQE